MLSCTCYTNRIDKCNGRVVPSSWGGRLGCHHDFALRSIRFLWTSGWRLTLQPLSDIPSIHFTYHYPTFPRYFWCLSAPRVNPQQILPVGTMEKASTPKKPDSKFAAPHQEESLTATSDLRSRLRSLFGSNDKKRPSETPSPTPASARTTTNSEEQEFGLSTATGAGSVTARTKFSSIRAANPDHFTHNYDGPAVLNADPNPSGPRKRSIQRGLVGSEGDGHSVSMAQEDSTTNGLSRSRSSLKEVSKQPDTNQPRRVKSTLTKKPTFPRRSLFNLKAAPPADSQTAEERHDGASEEPKLRVNHVPGSSRSEYDASIRTSRSSSPVSARDLVVPLPRRSFAAVSSRGSSVNEIGSQERNDPLPSKAPPTIEANEDEERPATAIPFLRPTSSSYTLRDTPFVTALRGDSNPMPVSLKTAMDRFEGQPSDSELVHAIEASSNQARTPILKPDSAVPAVDFKSSAGLPSAAPPITVTGLTGSHDRVNTSPRSKPMSASSDIGLNPTEQTPIYQLGVSDEFRSSGKPSGQPVRQLSPTPIGDGQEAQSSPPKDRGPDSKNHWMRQVLGQKSAPAMGQAAPNLTARPHHRSQKITDDIGLQRSSTVPAQATQLPADSELSRGSESFTRVITDLEGLLQQALQIAGNANNKATEDSGLWGTIPPNAGDNSRPRYAPQHDISDKSSDGSDSDASSDSPGFDEEQNRTTLPLQYAARYGNRSNVEERSETLAVPGRQLTSPLGKQSTFRQPLQLTSQGDPADVQNVLKSPDGVISSSVDTTDWAVKKPSSSATWRYPEPTEPPNASQKLSSAQGPASEPQGSTLRERRPSKTPAPAEANNLTAFSEPRSFSSDDDKEPIAYFNDRPASELQQRGASRRRRVVEGPPLGSGPLQREDVLTPLPSDVGGHGPGSDPKSLDLNHRHHFSIREPKRFNLSHSHRRSPIARDWSTSKKRWVALVACINTALMGLIIGIYAGEVPAIQYNIVDEHHYTILGNVVLFIGLAITTSVFWPLPLLYGRKPFTLAALAILMPLQFPQAVAVSGYRTPYTPTYRVSLLLSRAVAGLVMGFANINFIATLLDLFGASLQSINPHQEVVNVNDVRRHGGGMGIWLGIWTWSFIGSIGFGFFIGAVIISRLDVDWGFWVTIILTAFVLVLNVLVPEVRRSPYRRSFAEVRTPTELTRRVARGEVMMHLYSTGPKWWVEEVIAGSVLCLRMLKQPGFIVLSTYIGWIYGQIVMLILVGAH